MEIVSAADKTAWLFRVLGIGAVPVDEAAAELRDRLLSLGTILKQVGPTADPDAAVMLRTAIIAVKSGKPEAESLVLALEERLYAALSAARGREASASNPRTIGYTTSLIRWREAQARLSEEIETLGRTLLADKDVQTDPRFAQVKAFVDGLPGLVPSFSGALEDSINDGISATDDAARQTSTGKAITAIGGYRDDLKSASLLSALEVFAARQLHLNVGLITALDGTLTEIAGMLEAGRGPKAKV